MAINTDRSRFNGFDAGSDPHSRDERFTSPPVEEMTPPSPNALAYFQEGRLGIAMLLGLLYLLLALSIDAAGWVDQMTILVPVTLGALVMGMLMALSRFDGFFMISHSLSTGLAWVFFWMTTLVGNESRVAIFVDHGVPELQARAYFLLERWLEWMQAALSGSASNDNYVFILEISFLIWWLTYLGAWTVFRHGYVWRGVVMATVAILVNTYYAPNSVIGILVFFLIVAMLLLSWTNVVAHRQRWRALRVRFSQDIAFDFMRDGVIYTIAVITIAFLAPTLSRSAQFHQLMTPVNQRWESVTTEWNRLYQGINRQSRAVQSTFGRTLTLGGERNVSDSPVLQVAAPEGRYWRAVAFDTFTGRQWINTSSVEVRYDAGETINRLAWTSRRPLTQTVTLMAPMGSVILGAPDVHSASVPVEGLAAPLFDANAEADTIAQEGEFTWGRARRPLTEGDSYTVVSNYSDVTERDLRAASTDYPPAIVERYLQLPDDFSPRVGALADEIAGDEPTVYDKAKAIEQFLRGYEYDDEISGPASDQDPVEYFLFDEQRGYCDYYATSMAVMLRSLGIPSRTASGYAEGAYDRESNTYLITERDAHTWVEVFFPGYGWVEFEPTAGESTLDRPSGEVVESDSVPGAPENLPPQRELPQMDDGLMDQPLNNMEEINQPFFEDPVGYMSEPGRRWISWSVLLTLAALAGGWWLLRRRLYQGPDDFEASPANLFYQRLVTWAQRLGLVGQPGQTPYERSARLAQALPAGAALIERITDVYVHFRYAPRGQLSGAEPLHEELHEEWRQLRPILWKAWLRRKLKR